MISEMWCYRRINEYNGEIYLRYESDIEDREYIPLSESDLKLFLKPNHNIPDEIIKTFKKPKESVSHEKFEFLEEGDEYCDGGRGLLIPIEPEDREMGTRTGYLIDGKIIEGKVPDILKGKNGNELLEYWHSPVGFFKIKVNGILHSHTWVRKAGTYPGTNMVAFYEKL